MSFGPTDKFFDTGPFAKIEETVSAFSENLYFSFLFDESVKEQLKIDEEHEEALKNDDKDALSFANDQKQFFEIMFNLTLGYRLNEIES